MEDRRVTRFVPCALLGALNTRKLGESATDGEIKNVKMTTPKVLRLSSFKDNGDFFPSRLSLQPCPSPYLATFQASPRASPFTEHYTRCLIYLNQALQCSLAFLSCLLHCPWLLGPTLMEVRIMLAMQSWRSGRLAKWRFTSVSAAPDGPFMMLGCK